MSEPDHRRYQEDLAAYLLDALSPDEAREFEMHLASCQRCQAEERWLRAAVDILPSSVEQIEAPSEIREHLMKTAHGEARSARAEAAAHERGERRRRPARSRLRPLLQPATATIGALALVAAGIGGFLIGNSGGTKTITVRAQATPAQPTASAKVIRSGKLLVLRIDRLSVPRPRRVYEVWLVRKGSTTPEPSTLFVVRSDGSGATAIPGGVTNVQQVLVSEEPAGGSPSPTTKPVLSATL